jgi:hypothetical protein
MTVRDRILTAIVAALEGLAPEIEIEPSGDPSEFPSIALIDSGHTVLEREATLTRREMALTVSGFVEGEGGDAPSAERSALHAAIVAAIMADETLGGVVELVDDGDLRMSTAVLASQRRLGFDQDFAIQFTTSRINPAQPA